MICRWGDVPALGYWWLRRSGLPRCFEKGKRGGMERWETDQKLVFHGNSLEFFWAKNNLLSWKNLKPLSPWNTLVYFSEIDTAKLDYFCWDPVDPQRMPKGLAIAISYRQLYHYMKPSKDYSLFELLFIWFLHFWFLKILSLFLWYTNKRNRLFQTPFNHKKQHFVSE